MLNILEFYVQEKYPEMKAEKRLILMSCNLLATKTRTSVVDISVEYLTASSCSDFTQFLKGETNIHSQT